MQIDACCEFPSFLLSAISALPGMAVNILPQILQSTNNRGRRRRNGGSGGGALERPLVLTPASSWWTLVTQLLCYAWHVGGLGGTSLLFQFVQSLYVG
jgi:hypothetical protein